MSGILGRRQAHSNAGRSFCTTCRLLQPPKRLGESSARPLRTGPLTGATSDNVSDERRVRQPKRDREVEKSRARLGSIPGPQSMQGSSPLLEFIKTTQSQPDGPTPDGSSRAKRRPAIASTRAPDGSVSSVDRGKGERKPWSNHGPSWTAVARDKDIRFIGIDFASALPRIFSTRAIINQATPFFSIRLFPASALPLRPAPPFPLHAIAKKRQAMKAEAACVYAVVIASKAKVSKLAVERNKVRRKMMEAMGRVVNAPGGGGKGLVSPEHAYIISANPQVYDAPMEALVNDVERMLVTIKKKLDRGGDAKSGAELWLPEPRYLSKDGNREVRKRL
ncbi:hypothetical protein IAR50_001563 [Cryptococcus sp. DSM 104548]